MKKYLLYIDILGFSDLVKSSKSEIEKIYELIDSLNVHYHDSFKTIIFSDTILIFNKVAPITMDDHKCIVMYACEFVQDLMYKLADKNIYFRAILTYGNFKYSKLTNIEYYYGESLIYCYLKEKDINGMGLFIDKKIKKINTVFPTIKYDNELFFVFLLQSFQRLNLNTGGVLPLINSSAIDQTGDYWTIKFELKFLQNIYKNSITITDSKIRGKFLQTYQLYKIRYNNLLLEFETNGFRPETINKEYNWSNILETYD